VQPLPRSAIKSKSYSRAEFSEGAPPISNVCVTFHLLQFCENLAL
jgi:hypothetical protein